MFADPSFLLKLVFSVERLTLYEENVVGGIFVDHLHILQVYLPKDASFHII